MPNFIVTVKIERDLNHDPKNKQTGHCPISSLCTDVTGQHHSYIVQAKSPDEIREKLKADHITRIEQTNGKLVL